MRKTRTNRHRRLAAGVGLLLRERMVLALALAAAMAAAIGGLRGHVVTGMHEDAFWAMKVDWRRCADAVLAGDSRVLLGLSPAEMAGDLPALRVRNYAFAGMGYSADYLRAVEGVLDPASRRKVIMLGVTPHSLSRGATEENGFIEHTSQPANRRAVTRAFGEVLRFFRRLSVYELSYALGLPKGKVIYCHYERDGWAGFRQVPPDPRETLGLYRKLFDPARHGPASEEVAAGLIEAVRRWRRAGIEVYGFRPPSTPAMVALEREVAGFDEGAFVAAFEAAGGTWLRLEPLDYRTYDGSHLERDEARAFSRRFARKLRELREGGAAAGVRTRPSGRSP
jgi:hypothetical protein